MAILEIKRYPDRILKRKARDVDSITDADRKLIRDMFETMYISGGVGLAAPQVGVSKRIIVCNPTGEKKDELAVINPRILYRKGRKIKDCEGCLSVPGITAEVARFSILAFSGMGPRGQEIRQEARDLPARIIDHETDHLDGVLFIDRLGFLKKKMLIARYKKKMTPKCMGRSY